MNGAQRPARLSRRRLLQGMGTVAAMLLGPPAFAAAPASMAVLVYHRFGANVPDSTTVRTTDFLDQIAAIGRHAVDIIPLRQIAACAAQASSCPTRPAVAITVDDGHISVFTELFPIIRAKSLPLTLFIYPSAISNASYALTWEQIRAMVATGLVEVQSHTLWHPNFTVERKRLSPDAYKAFVRRQLTVSKAILEQKLGQTVDMLAWPYGIYDTDLEHAAKDAGYRIAFSIDRRSVRIGDDPFALPRYMITDHDRGAPFDAILRSITSSRGA